ncbi:MAG: Crp/Fnr family transcriptional regulator [Polyangiaceae bacterium]
MDLKNLAARVPFFRHLKAEELDRLTPHIEVRTLKRGEKFWYEGQLGDSFAFLLRGRVKFAKTTLGGREAITHLSGPGEMLCASTVCEFKPHCCSTTALEEETDVVTVPRHLVMELFERSPSVARALLGEITKRSITACERIEELSSGQVEQRLATVLLKLGQRAGVRRPDGLWIPIPLSRQDMAEMCGTTVETCIRTISRLRENGVLETRSSGYLITDRTALEMLARAADNLVQLRRRSQPVNDLYAVDKEEAPKKKRAARSRRSRAATG